MRQISRILLGVAGGLAWCASVEAIAPSPSSNQYQSIAQRNAFGLKPPAPVTPPPPAIPPPPKIMLTGIVEFFGRKQALLKAALPGPKPGEQGKEETYILSEGQREGGIEVLAIDVQAGSVRVDDYGTIQTVTFEQNEAKPPPAGNSPGAPGPAGTLPTPASPGPRNGLRSIPTRLPHLPAVAASAGSPEAATGAPTLPGPAGTGLPPTGMVPAPD